MKNREIRFYLTSTDARPTLTPRKCTVIQELWSEERQDYFLRIQIEPPVHGGYFGIIQEQVDDLVVAPRYLGTSLNPLSGYPMVVFVCYIVNCEIRRSGLVAAKDLQILLIGELYHNYRDAEDAISFEPERI